MSGVASGLPLSTTVTRIVAAWGGCARRLSEAAPQQPFGAVADDRDLEFHGANLPRGLMGCSG